jgi:dUTP pyrophosphatase
MTSTSDVLQIERTHPDAVLPTRAHGLSAGLDLYAINKLTLEPYERGLVNTGICVEIPKGYYGQIASRSGYSLRDGLVVLSGVIDAGYVGNIYVILCNLSSKTFTVEKNMKIAQLIVHSIATPKVVEVSGICSKPSIRGANGFGSSGF